ncbi:hypothetical protein TanjilG_17826 [Lupinus angustifolius]|uniref:Uncharacterized protein n=1 Tax=Lupinus angustifolius TaxID=3871 RepID=A0A4P1QPU9_LUPAN|nr:PREDICTED: putative uncharacterized protein DDB_G0282133 [Lupinus angustifolius]OIV91834.1 hypothetical protein TanjilG_17826 [Lupinus angustifolius]
MKKLYRKGSVHPSPPIITDHLSFLPAAILTLAAALSPEDREVLAYLISCSSNNNFSGNSRRSTTSNKNSNNNSNTAVAVGDHAPLFNCSCFRCYTSYWVRWDSSPNRQLIHEIIDAFEEWLAQQNNSNNIKGCKNGKKEKRNNKKGLNNNKKQTELNRVELVSDVSSELESVEESNDTESGNKVADEEKGSVRRFVSFIGEKIWGGWVQ